uniref:Uncharacterized protein n=1 Tax=Eutreptiella gymnastica TaxID=73025 RepID=A0A7S1N148_9EUGL|mmetsp:Transcript_105248/g.181482  ORF Transcript_105248/g.181482 Transcript_105248/m.181482 type:complete len:154 (+) Transcript_105248:1124-1585(+)
MDLHLVSTQQYHLNVKICVPESFQECVGNAKDVENSTWQWAPQHVYICWTGACIRYSYAPPLKKKNVSLYTTTTRADRALDYPCKKQAAYVSKAAWHDGCTPANHFSFRCSLEQLKTSDPPPCGVTGCRGWGKRAANLVGGLLQSTGLALAHP